MKHNELIRQARLTTGMNQEQAAEKYGIGASTLSQWENDIHRPNLANFVGFIRMCGHEVVCKINGQEIEL